MTDQLSAPDAPPGRPPGVLHLLARKVNVAFSDLLDLCYPPVCAACRAPRAGRSPFCPACAEALEPVPLGCGRCGRPGPDRLCGACLARPPAFDALRAAGLYGGPLAEAIHALKYQNRPALARPLGAWLAARIALPAGAAIVPVPLGSGRRRSRGYDQAALLARSLARHAGGLIHCTWIRRSRETTPQVGKDRRTRHRNVRGAFTASHRAAGEDVILVDDVITTGATAGACASALKEAGARSVTVVALALAE